MYTLPVNSATAERSLGGLKLIKTYLRFTISEEKLTNLSILTLLSRHIEQCTAVKNDFYEAIETFAQSKKIKIKKLL